MFKRFDLLCVIINMLAFDRRAEMKFCYLWWIHVRLILVTDMVGEHFNCKLYFVLDFIITIDLSLKFVVVIL